MYDYNCQVIELGNKGLTIFMKELRWNLFISVDYKYKSIFYYIRKGTGVKDKTQKIKAQIPNIFLLLSKGVKSSNGGGWLNPNIISKTNNKVHAGLINMQIRPKILKVI